MKLLTPRRFAALAALGLVASAGLGVLTARVRPLEAAVEYPPELGIVGVEIPPYPNAQLLPLGDRVHTGGADRAMAYGITPDPAERVAERYAELFRGRGLSVRLRALGDERVITATDLPAGLIRTVVVADTGNGTSIIASVADPGADEAPLRVPVPPRCDVADRSGATDGALTTEVVTLRCEAAIADVATFYDGRLAGSERRALLEPTVDRKSLRVTYTSARLSVTVAADQPPEPTPVTAVSVSWQEVGP